MIYDIDFAAWGDSYAPYLLDRYAPLDRYTPHALPRLWDFEEGSLEEREYLRNVQDKYSKWVSTLLRVRCEDAGLSVTSMDDSSIHSRLGNFIAPSDVLGPDTWVGEKYKIMFIDSDYNHDMVKLLSVIGQALHDHGVESEKHNIRGLVDRESREAMFKAMMVDNILGELYPIVEDMLSAHG